MSEPAASAPLSSLDRVEQVLMSERIGQVEERLGALEELARSSDVKLGRLVEIEERRDRREEAAAQLEREERAARSSWQRRIIEKALVPVLTALGSGGLVAGWLGSQAATPPPNSPAVSAPAPDPTDGP